MIQGMIVKISSELKISPVKLAMHHGISDIKLETRILHLPFGLQVIEDNKKLFFAITSVSIAPIMIFQVSSLLSLIIPRFTDNFLLP